MTSLFNHFNNSSFWWSSHTWGTDQKVGISAILQSSSGLSYSYLMKLIGYDVKFSERLFVVVHHIVHLVSVSSSAVRTSDVLLMALNTYLRHLRKHSAPGRLQWCPVGGQDERLKYPPYPGPPLTKPVSVKQNKTKSKDVPKEASTCFSQVACLLISWIWVSTIPEVLIPVRQKIFAMAQTPCCWQVIQSNSII